MQALRFFVKLFGKHKGNDRFGNAYYSLTHQSKERRFVFYKGLVEASKVPPDWHGWLHKETNCVPEGVLETQIPNSQHRPNLTGTRFAHLKRDRGTKYTHTFYFPWEPS